MFHFLQSLILLWLAVIGKRRFKLLLSYVDNILCDIMNTVCKRCDVHNQLREDERILTSHVIINEIGVGVDTPLCMLHNDLGSGTHRGKYHPRN